MKILGVEFAPLFIPTERRLQTLGVMHYTYAFLFFGFGMLLSFIYIFLFTSYWYIPLAYSLWYYMDHQVSEQGGRRSNWVRHWTLFEHAARYFPLELHKTEELHPGKNYIFACHPHGVMSQSHFHNFATEGTGFSKKFPGIKPYLCVLAGQFMFPIFRDYFLLTGSISVSKQSLEWVLAKEGKGNAVAIMIGGAAEALDAHAECLKLKLKPRKGFCRLALKHGADIVPVFTFGENGVFDQVPNPPGSKLRRFQNFLTHLVGFSPALFHGRGIFNYSFGLMPHRKPMYSVIGAPVHVDKTDDASPEIVNALHEKYTAALVDLFESNKLKYGLSEKDHLEIE